MSAEGWILMVGLRVVDLGLLAAWLVWFFRLRNDDPGDDESDGGGGPDLAPRDGSDPRGPGVRLPHGDRRVRDRCPAPRRAPSRRPASPAPTPLPARVRRPATPAPARHR